MAEVAGSNPAEPTFAFLILVAVIYLILYKIFILNLFDGLLISKKLKEKIFIQTGFIINWIVTSIFFSFISFIFTICFSNFSLVLGQFDILFRIQFFNHLILIFDRSTYPIYLIQHFSLPWISC